MLLRRVASHVGRHVRRCSSSSADFVDFLPEEGRAPTAAELRTSMRRWAHGDGGRRKRGHDRGSRKRAFPASFGGGCDKVATGKWRTVDESSSLRFRCTGCGACCRSLPDSVLLDPADVLRMSRALGVDTRTFVTDNAGGLRNNITFTIGMYSFDSLPPMLVRGQTERRPRDVGIPIGPHRQGSAPALFIESNKLDASRQAGVVQARDGEKVCPFATGTGPADGDLYASLACSLGRDGMPTACALYPLGELWTCVLPDEEGSEDHRVVAGGEDPGGRGGGKGGEADGRNTVGSKEVHYFSVDTHLCEGVDHEDAGTRTVAQYRMDNDLHARREQWRWFQDVALAFASHGLYDDLGEEYDRFEDHDTAIAAWTTQQRVSGAASTAWFDFDSDSAAPIRCWEDLQAHIVTRTCEILVAAESLKARVRALPATASPDDVYAELDVFEQEADSRCC